MGPPECLAHAEGSRFCQGKDWGAQKSAPRNPAGEWGWLRSHSRGWGVRGMKGRQLTWETFASSP